MTRCRSVEIKPWMEKKCTVYTCILPSRVAVAYRSGKEIRATNEYVKPVDIILTALQKWVIGVNQINREQWCVFMRTFGCGTTPKVTPLPAVASKISRRVYLCSDPLGDFKVHVTSHVERIVPRLAPVAEINQTPYGVPSHVGKIGRAT